MLGDIQLLIIVDKLGAFRNSHRIPKDYDMSPTLLGALGHRRSLNHTFSGESVITHGCFAHYHM